MNLKKLKECVKISKKFYTTEASGNISLKNVSLVASSGVDRISIGGLTHTVKPLDFKIEI